MFRSKFIAAAVLASVALLAAPAVSEAALTITFSDGVNSVTIHDGDAVDTNGNTGAIALGTDLKPDNNPAATTGGYRFDGYAIALTANYLPGTNQAQIVGSTSTTIQQVGPTVNGPLTIKITEDGVTAPTGPLFIKEALTMLSITNGSAGLDGSATAANNVPPGPAGSATTTNIHLTTAPSLGTQSTTFTEATNPYSLSQNFTLSLSGNGAWASFQGTASALTAVPAPAGLVMLASALPVAGLLRLRRRKA